MDLEPKQEKFIQLPFSFCQNLFAAGNSDRGTLIRLIIKWPIPISPNVGIGQKHFEINQLVYLKLIDGWLK